MSDLRNDIGFIRRYFKIFGYLGIFPLCLSAKQYRLNMFWNCLISLLLTMFIFGAASSYPLRIDMIYKYTEIPLLVVDIIEHLVEHFTIIVIFYGAIRNSESWTLNFKDLTQVKNKLETMGSYTQFRYTLHLLKIIGYHTVLLVIYICSSYWNSRHVYLYVFHRALQFYILVVIIFFIELMRSIWRRYCCLGSEVTKIFLKYKNKGETRVIDDEIRDIKLMYGILNDLMHRVNTKFGPHIFLTLSCQLLGLLNTFNWFLLDDLKNEPEHQLLRQVVDLFLDPLNYCVSK